MHREKKKQQQPATLTRSPLCARLGWMLPCRVRPVLRPAFLQMGQKENIKTTLLVQIPQNVLK